MVFNRGHKYNERRDEEFQLQRGIYKNGMRRLADVLIHKSLSYKHVINIYTF